MNRVCTRLIRLFICLSIFLSLAGCSKPDGYIDFRKPQPPMAIDKEAEKEERPLIIAVAAVISPQETIDCYRLIAQRIAESTGRSTALIQRKTYAEINTLLANGGADMAFLSTGAYSSYRGLHEIELLAMAELDGDIQYTTDIIVHKDSDINDFSDLAGRSFAFTDPLSFSGHVVIEDILFQQNTAPSKYFKRYFYTYSHDKSLWAVANHVVDAASIDSQIYEYTAQNNPELTNSIRIIASVNPAPTGPVVVRKDLTADQKAGLRQIFLEMNQDPELAKAMRKLMIDRFVDPQPELYLPLEEIYDRISMRYENDV